MDVLIRAFELIITPQTLLVIIAASLFGVFVGAIPGLTATMATALLVPLTFYMEPVPAIAAIIACTAMAITAGDIPGILLRIPGTPSNAAYVDESYLMTLKGQANAALGIAIVGSTIGGLIGFCVLLFTAPALGKLSIQFSSFEFFWLALLGLSCAVMISSGGVLKGALSLFLGLFISTIGLDSLTGSPRFTMGITQLSGGISLVPAMVGMFALSEILRYSQIKNPAMVPKSSIGNIFSGIIPLLWKFRVNVLRGSAIGSAIGALPGADSLGAWVSYAMAKRMSKTPEKFGTGHPEGLVEATSNNNAGLSAAWIPAMVFGLPGDSITAIAVGVLTMKGMTPGPTIFIENAHFFYAIMIVFVIANLLMIPFGWLAVAGSRHLFGMPRSLLNAGVLALCIVGSFAINNTAFDIGIMLVVGLCAYVLEAKRFPVAPIILGIVIGPLLEQNFLTSLIIADGNPLAFFNRPIALVLAVIAILVWMIPTFRLLFSLRKPKPSVG